LGLSPVWGNVWNQLKRNLTILAICIAFFAGGWAASAADDPAGIEFFEAKIRPILVDNCYKCHSLYSKKVKGGLLLDSRDGVLKGGDTGPAIKPGDPDQSLLIKAIRYTDEKLQMPPKDKKLSAEKIGALEAWVKMGAPDPRVSKTPGLGDVNAIRAKAKTHWAFLPVKNPVPPDVNATRFVRTPVDNFVLSKLEAAHLEPSPEADKRTLIRRATFDLIGLPPKPEEVAAFEADKSPDAFEKVIDRLLASPRYGERWGRHWLDVARYADTKGYVFEEDRHYPYSYSYRDYVIRSFNQDLPYNQFLKQQIAADLMTNGADKRALAALGYLTLGRRFLNNQPDIIDDRIDVVCRGMMGLTVACARCHDHKYDPIPTKDYYSLYGVFASSMEPEKEPLLGMEEHNKQYEEYLAEHKRRQNELDTYRTQQEVATAADLRAKSGAYLLAAHECKPLTKDAELETVAGKYKLDLGVIRRWMSGLDAWAKDSNAVFTAWFDFAKLPEKDFAAKAKELIAHWNESGKPVNPIVAKAFATNPPASMKDVAESYGKIFNDIDHRWHEALASTNAPAPTRFTDEAQEALRQFLYAAGAPANLPTNEFERLYDVPTAQKIRALRRSVDELDATHPGAPPRAMALEDRPEPVTQHVFIRGNSGNPGAEVPRQFLEILAGPNRKPFQHGSGRLELAEAIASTKNPLTARVFVNRVWLYHFGVPLVSTPSDFGLRSDPPSNPELLDYLASHFMADGWSIKKLHKLIMLSGTYRQSSDDNLRCAKIDPGNTLLWRMNRQRLDFEAMRDTLLMVSGRIDLTAGGHSLDIIDPAATRRTVYGYIDRQNLPDLFRAFDFASPDSSSARRFYTTVPQQALFLMNSPFIIEQAKSLVSRPDFEAERTEKEKVRLLYELAFQREPTAEEIALAHQFTHGANSTEPSPAALTNWVFGYGSFDASSNRVKHFRKLPYFDGNSFQGGPTLPDPKLGWVLLTSGGGHPGDQQHCSIRRWIAPRDGTIAITGTISHNDAQGDGVRGRIVSSQNGVLGQWVVHNSKHEANVENVSVKQGDTIDFVTDCYDTFYYDSYGWAPNIRYVADGKTVPGQRMEWDAQKDFAESARTAHPSLDAWQKYAQVILLTNELIFVD